MAVPMTPSAVVADFGGRRYRRFIPFNFLLSLAAPHLLGVLLLDIERVALQPKLTSGDVETSEQLFIAGIIVASDNLIASVNETGDHCSLVMNLSTPVNSLLPVSLTPVKNIHS
jgi:hypothetical protein